MRLNVDVAYLDAHGGSDQQATIHHFKPQQATGGEEISEELLLQITLLYRPGHYDILYRD
jgi:hypothetical protein